MQISTNKKPLSSIILVSALLITAFTLFYTLRFFIDAFLGAIIFYVLFRKFQRFLTDQKKWRKGLAAILIILISFLVIVIPVTVVLDLIVPRITLFFSEGSITMSAIKELDNKLGAATGYQLLNEQNLQGIQARAGEFITGFFSTSISILTVAWKA
jgi:predicted PurR-regulated permease PerM